MKTRTIILLAALLLTAGSAQATIDPGTIGFRVVSDPGHATLGEPFELVMEIKAGLQVNLFDIQMESTNWSNLQFTQPDMTLLEEGETARFTLSGIPKSADADLDIVLGTDQGDFRRSVKIRQWLPNKERFEYRLEPLPAELESVVLPGTPDRSIPTDTTPPSLFVELVKDPRYGQDPDDTDDVAQGDKASYALHVEGRVLFSRDDGKLVGPYGAYARLYDEDSSWDEHLGTTTIDEYGYFSFDVTWDPCWVCDSTPDLYVEIESDSQHVRVQESGILEREYFWVTPTRDDYSAHYLNLGTWYINHDEWGVAADILTTLTRAYQWLDEEPGISVQKIHVQWPSDECSGATACYKPTFEEIHISHDRDWRRDTYIHEWGHHIMENWGSHPSPEYCNPGGYCDNGGCPDDGGHCLWCSENGAIALTEGFPNWMADRVLRYWDEEYWPHPPFNNRSQENIGYCDSLANGTIVWGDPELTEGHFGALLRDLEDATMDRHENYPGSMNTRDRLALGAVPVMQVMLGYDDDNNIYFDPQTPSDFIQFFLERFPDTPRDAFWWTTRNCGYEIDTTPPLHPNNLDSPTHLAGVPSHNAIVEFTWDLPTDDMSGLAGFSWAIGGASPIMPDEQLDISLQGHEEIGPLPPGTYHFSVRSKDYAGNWSPYFSSFGPIIIREATPVDLVCSQNMGWEFPLVPRSDNLATVLDVHLTPTLPGDVAGTYWNYAGNNAGETPVPGDDFTVGLYLDGRKVMDWFHPVVGGHTSYFALNAGPVLVSGGRHTLEIRHDADGDVMEADENNNIWARQFVWTPKMLVPGAVNRIQETLPDPVAGHEWIEDGVPVFPNCRGFAFEGGTGFDAVSLVNLSPTDDFDLSLHPASTGSQDGFTGTFAFSDRSFEEVDMVFVNGNNLGAQDWNLGVVYDRGHDSGDYEIQHVQGVPLPATGYRIIALEAGDYVDLTEVSFTSTTGPITVKLWTDPAAVEGFIHIGRLNPQLQYSSPNTLKNVHTLGLSGSVEFEIDVPPPGENCFVVYRDPRDSQGIIYLRLDIIPQQPNIVPITLSGWDGPIVPTRTALPAGPAVLPSFLNGDTGDTYFNWALMNLSHNRTETGVGFRVMVKLDGRAIASPIVPDVFGGFAAWEFGTTPRTVQAGRHSLAFRTDTRNEIEEYNEDDNDTGSQFVWRPNTMTKNTTITRTAPPPMTAGWEDLAPGSFYFNCDGVRTPEFDTERDGLFAAVAILPAEDVNYDLRLHNTSFSPESGFRSALAASTWGPGLSDYILVDFTESRSYEFDAAVTKAEGTADYIIQNVTAEPLLLVQGQTRYGPFTLDEGQIMALHELDLPRMGVDVTVEIGRYAADLGVSFHVAGDAYQAKSDAQAAAWFAGPGEDETIYVTESNTMRQCIAVWKRNTGADIPRVDYYLVFNQVSSTPPDLLVDGFALHPAVPNPFNPQTTIAFDLPGRADVRLHIYDMAGHRVRALLDGEPFGSGRHEVIWNGRDDSGRTVAAGTYFYRLATPGFAETRRMALIK